MNNKSPTRHAKPGWRLRFMSVVARGLAVAGLPLLVACGLLQAAPQHEHHMGMHGSPEKMQKVIVAGEIQQQPLDIPDLRVLDQHGRQHRFYSDLIKGKVVAMNFMFTTCTTICPPLTINFRRVQKKLKELYGPEAVQLISVSVDPVTDTPARLKAWAEKFHAEPGWTFVTGEKETIDILLDHLGASTAQKEDHPPLALVVNDRTGQWVRGNGLAPANRIVELVQRVLEVGEKGASE